MVGLTGGIGAGKSVVAARLAARGAVIIDSDRLARDVVAAGTDGLREVVATFGERVLDADRSLDRAALGAVVFNDDAARRRLEAIIHPRVRARAAELVAAAAPDAIVVNDVPLLVEVGLAPTYHLVIVVEAAQATRVVRLIGDRGMTEEEAYTRIRAQADDPVRRAAADVVLRNEGAVADLYAAVDVLWDERLVPYEHNVRERRPAARDPRVIPGDHDPDWPTQFRRLAARIRHALGPTHARIDHIGSTAVPGLPATDVIDIQLAVSSLDEADGLADRLALAGFPRYTGEWWDVERPLGADEGPAGAGGRAGRWEERLHGSADPGRPVHLHVRVLDSPGFRHALLMRDHLRADAEQRAAYLALKRRLAATAPDVAASAEAKDPWFDEEHRRAEAWAAATGWRP